MTIMSGITVLCVLGSLVVLVWSKLNQKNPEGMGKIMDWVNDKKEKTKEKNEGMDEYTRQKWEEKRTIM